MKEVEVYRRDAVLSGKYGRDHIVAYQAQLYEIKAQPTAMLALIVEGLSQILRADKIFTDQEFA